MLQTINQYRDICAEEYSTINFQILKKIPSNLASEIFLRARPDYLKDLNEFVANAEQKPPEQIGIHGAILDNYYNSLGLFKMLTDFLKTYTDGKYFQIYIDPRMLVPDLTKIKMLLDNVCSTENISLNSTDPLRKDIDLLISYFYSFTRNNETIDEVVLVRKTFSSDTSKINEFNLRYKHKDFNAETIKNRSTDRFSYSHSDNLSFVTNENIYCTESITVYLPKFAITQNKAFIVYLHIISLFIKFLYSNIVSKNILNFVKNNEVSCSIFSVTDDNVIKYIDALSELSNIVSNKIDLDLLSLELDFSSNKKFIKLNRK